MSLYSRYQLWIHAAILIASCFLVFANGYDHAFNLDSPDGLVNNPAVRDFSNIPSYFRDPTTLTTYRANAEYRPVLQITFALNYAVSGYQMSATDSLSLLALGSTRWHDSTSRRLWSWRSFGFRCSDRLP